MVSVKKPFGCSVCHLSFRLAKSLVKHVAIHNSNESKSKIHNSSGAKSKILNSTGAKSKIHNSNEVQEEAMKTSDVNSVPRNKDLVLQKMKNKFKEASKETPNKSSENSKESKIEVQNSSLKSPAKKEANKGDVESVPGSKGSIQVLKSKKYILWATLVNVAKEWPLR